MRIPEDEVFSEMQWDFFARSTHRWNVKEGATRSGKTFMDYFLIPMRIGQTKNEGLIVLIGNTRGTLERNILDPMRELWGPTLVGYPKPNNTVRLFGRKAYVLGADKISQVARLQGAGIEYCYGDEVATWNEEVFQMLKSRLSAPGAKFDGTCNPDNPSHWFKRFLDSDADIYRQRYTIDDNPFLDPEFVEGLKREYAGTVYYKRFILGEWALAEGLVYQNVNPDDFPEKAPATTSERYVAIDYGTRNPCAFLMIERGADGAYYVTDEYYHDSKVTGRQKTDEEYIEDFKAFIKDRPPRAVVIDPSAASFATALWRAGYPVTPAKNDVLDGIRTTAAAINTGRLVPTKACPNLMREFGAYCWDEKAGEDRPVKAFDHALDALRYFAYLRFAAGGRQIRT